MNKIRYWFRFEWVRMVIYSVAAIVVTGALVAAIELTVMRIKQDIVNAKKGIHVLKMKF